jgi:hypothetical protein
LFFPSNSMIQRSSIRCFAFICHSFTPHSLSLGSPVLLCYRSLLCLLCFFFCFGGGLPLHKVHFLIFRNPLEIPTTYFAIFPQKVTSTVFLLISPLSRCNRCSDPRPLM